MKAPCSGAICIIETPPSARVSSISSLLHRVGGRSVGDQIVVDLGREME